MEEHREEQRGNSPRDRSGWKDKSLALARRAARLLAEVVIRTLMIDLVDGPDDSED